MLYLVATPIGNLKDISERAIEILGTSSLILCEDTRQFGKLASTYGITTKKLSFYEQNEEGRIQQVLEHLKNGEQISLVSDAGTPTINDPGYRLVSTCREENIQVSTVPGPNAAIAALSISGLPTDKFSYAGYIPVKPGKRKAALGQALKRSEPTIFYESPHKILKSLEMICELEPTRTIFLARELTKMHEECLQMPAEKILETYKAKTKILGEIVLIIAGEGKRKKA